MTVSYITGDLFDPSLKFDALAHGCNCSGVMGAGIAREFKRRYPAMFRAYKLECDFGRFKPGVCWGYWPNTLTRWNDAENPAPTTPAVFNLATQRRPGPRATLGAIQASIASMLQQCRTNPEWEICRIGMPRIGCGLGGLNWNMVMPLIEYEAERVPAVEIVVVSLATDVNNG